MLPRYFEDLQWSGATFVLLVVVLIQLGHIQLRDTLAIEQR
jgi:hypothetical protein